MNYQSRYETALFQCFLKLAPEVIAASGYTATAADDTNVKAGEAAEEEPDEAEAVLNSGVMEN